MMSAHTRLHQTSGPSVFRSSRSHRVPILTHLKRTRTFSPSLLPLFMDRHLDCQNSIRQPRKTLSHNGECRAPIVGDTS